MTAEAAVRRGPVARLLDAAEARPLHLDGNLDREHGFLPRRLSPRPLPASHAAWEEALAQLPELAHRRDAQQVLAGLPTLASDPGSLPDDALPWAATVLGNLAHAYWHFGLERMYEPRNLVDDNRLPPAIEVPWHEVCSRTGRPFCGLTLEDEMFNNFALEAPAVVGADGQYDVEDVRVDRITVPAAAYGSESERVFLAAFSEIHAMLAPIPGLLEELEELLPGGPDAVDDVESVLDGVVRSLQRATAGFRKISPSPRSRTYCDPVDWAKTVVTFQVPAEGYPVGPSGSATPLVQVMDALVGRQRYDTDLGALVVQLGGTQLPSVQQELCRLVRALDLRGWVAGTRRSSPRAHRRLVTAFDQVHQAYAGDAGFLGVHRAKVVDYLMLSTVLGRNQTTAHEQTFVNGRSWTAMGRRLRDAAEERGA
ncbi:hypothetical protein [Angustibacter aerolatus]